MNADLLRIFPETILTITGILIMLIEPLMKKGATRRPIGWLAVIGTLFALSASISQMNLGPGQAYYGMVQTDAYSGFFHTLIAAIVLVSLLISIDSIKGDTENLGELYALTVFGAVGAMLKTSAVDLLHLDLHPRRLPQEDRQGPRVGAQVLPARLLRHRVFSLRNSAHLRRDRHH